MSDKETSGYSARSSQVSIAFEVRGCPRGRKATISSSATKCTSAKSGGNSKGLTSKAKSNFFVRNHVPHLYGAGELGGISAGRYQAGENIAECLIFGKIAGLNAARVKEEVFEHTTEEMDAVSSASQTEKKVNLGSDLDVKETYMVGANQYLGRSNAGVGNEVVVRITVDDDKKLKDIEILKQSETGIGAQAIESMPKEMISKNTYDVDSISGASPTSRALKEAVKDAMNKI